VANYFLIGNTGLMGRWTKRGLAAVFTGVVAALMTACGGGGVSSAPSSPDTAISVLPSTATVYPNIDTTFTISGGRPPYIVASQNPAAIPNPTVNGSTFVVRPANVQANTTASVEIRDASSPPKTLGVSLNIVTSTLDNAITITNNSGSCGAQAQLCSGSDAIATVRSVINNVAQANRQVRFEAFQGDFGFVAAGSSAIANTLVATTGVNGTANVIIRARPTAQPQPAILQVVDVDSGLTRRFVFSIGLSTDGNNNITVIPDSQTWQAPFIDACVTGAISSHYIFGGTPPYLVTSTNTQFATLGSSSGSSTTEGTIVQTSGGAVLIAVTGQICSLASAGTVFIVQDAVGRRTTFTVSNLRGANSPPPNANGQVGAPTVAPTSLGPLGCDVSASAFVNQVLPAGFTGVPPTITVTSLDPTRLEVTQPVGGIFTVRRLTTGGSGPGSLIVRVSNGTQFVDVVVTLDGVAPFGCASAGGAQNPITVSTSTSITLANGAAIPITITGGRPPYVVSSSAPTVAQVSADGTAYVTPGWVNIPNTATPPAIVAEAGRNCIQPTFPAPPALPAIPPSTGPNVGSVGITPPDDGPGAVGNTCYIFVPRDGLQVANQFTLRALRRNAIGQSGFITITDSSTPTRFVQLIVVTVN
jgi:hypothetical protein